MKKKIICIFVMTLLIVTASPAVGMMNAFPSNNSLIEKTGAEDYMMTNCYERQKLVASDSFGWSVSMDGNYAIIGAPDDDGNEPASGSAYIFTRSGTTWTQKAKLLASDGATDDNFGYSVSIDGDYAIIGAYRDDSNRGAAYIFKRTGTSWAEEDKLTASDGTTGDIFGGSVSIDGDYALIGVPGDDGTGSAYVFKRDGTNWNEQDKLLASDGAAFDSFGCSVSIDGDYAIIGADVDDFTRGSAYIFKRTGTSWAEEDKLTASDGTYGDLFGWSVSIDGDYAIIGAPLDDDNGDGSGSAYVFKRDGTNWNKQDKLLASDGAAGDYFGGSVSIDGDYAIIGADGDDSQMGSAYVFKRDGTAWIEQDKLLDSYGAYSNTLLLRLLERFPLIQRLLKL